MGAATVGLSGGRLPGRGREVGEAGRMPSGRAPLVAPRHVPRAARRAAAAATQQHAVTARPHRRPPAPRPPPPHLPPNMRTSNKQIPGG
ncbi:unnamed protein product, partial [Brenthis ino]